MAPRERKSQENGASEKPKDTAAAKAQFRHASRPTPRQQRYSYQRQNHSNRHGSQQFQNHRPSFTTGKKVSFNVPNGGRCPSFVSGHRGFAHLPWRRVPREPAVRRDGQSLSTVFVDGLHVNMAKEWLHDLFSEYGRVRDVYIASKIRKYSKDGFGFVRYNKKVEALKAVENLDGRLVKGKMLRVSMAMYDKDGQAYLERTNERSKNTPHPRNIKSPSWRDGRSYNDVVNGKQSKEKVALEQKGRDKNREERNIPEARWKEVSGTKKKRKRNIPHVRIPLRAVENVRMVEKLEKVLVVKLGEKMSQKEAANLVANSEIPVSGMSSLNHNLIVLFFENVKELEDAMEKGSPLWTYFADVRRWSDEQNYNDRLVWIECHGLHPKCWSYENYKAIGEKWGKVIHIDHEKEGMVCLTFARVLVQTKIQLRIDECIQVEWEAGVCDVWAKEVECYKVHKENKWRRGTMFDESDNTEGVVRDNGENNIATKGVGRCEKTTVADLIMHDNEYQGGYNHIVNPEIIVEDEGNNGLIECSNGKDIRECQRENKNGTQLLKDGTQGEGMGIFSNYGNEGGSTASLERVEVMASACLDEVSIDEMLIGHYSCPIQGDQAWFDPMVTIESSMLSSDGCSPVKANDEMGKHSKGTMKGTTSKRTRGRPKRMGNSLPVPLSVLSTPTERSMEAVETWRMAKQIGVTTPKDDAIITELRKSKRIQKLEENNRVRLDE
ncbi:unnamed protein product [Amaranthus hypochondriacus]